MHTLVWFALLGALACGPDAQADGPAPPLPAAVTP
jgi:hypothetical protein